MKKEKQELLNRVLKNPTYKVDAERGKILSLNAKSGVWMPLIGANVDGYVQHKLSFHNEIINVYEHIAIWFYVNGFYEEGLVVGHQNNIRNDNRVSNLSLITQSKNVLDSITTVGRTKKRNKKIGNYHIIKIRQMVSCGKSLYAISKSLGINYSSIRYYAIKMKAGKRLKKEKRWANYRQRPQIIADNL